MKKNPSHKRHLFNILLSILLFVVATCGSIIVFATTYQTFKDAILENTQRGEHVAIQELALEVTHTTTLEEIALLLHEQEFIGSKALFLTQAKLSEDSSTLIPGTYTLHNNMTNSAILDLLTLDPNDAPTPIHLTIPEGYTVLQIANKVDDLGLVTRNEFIAAVNDHTYDYDFLANIPEDAPYRLEGYLFPDTYYIYPGTSAEEIVITMLHRFEEISSRYSQYLYGTAYTLHDVVTIASIIEQEAKVSEERAIISGVIYNRLESQMKLQMCSTIQYSMDSRKPTLTYEDLAIDSPYNTYMYDGLPLGPISCPGEETLKAAFSPDEHDFYYFVLNDTIEGTHTFNETATQHLASKATYKFTHDQNFME